MPTTTRPVLPPALFLVPLFLLLAACGSDDGASDTTASAPAETAAPETADSEPAETAETAAPETAETAAPETAETAAPETADSETAETAASGAAGEVDVSLVEWEVRAPDEYAVGTTTFDVTSDGEFPHELVVIVGDGYASLPQRPNGAVIEDELEPGSILGRTGKLQPGELGSLTVELEPGNYVLLCNIVAGPTSHAGKGQTLDVTAS